MARTGPVTALALALAAACAPTPPERQAAPGEWRTFEGTWSAAGDRRSIDTGGGGRASTVELTGSVLLHAGAQPGLGAGFQARVLAYADGASIGAGRAVWTDERGDEIFSELHLDRVEAGRSISGHFTGGTGRWRGIEGEYRLTWSWVVEAEAGRVQGRTVSLQGRARVVAPGEGSR